MNEAGTVITVFEFNVPEVGWCAGINDQYPRPFVGICHGISTEADRVFGFSLRQNTSINGNVVLSADENLAACFDCERYPVGNHHVVVDNPGRIRLFQGQIIFNESGHPAGILGRRYLAGFVLNIRGFVPFFCPCPGPPADFLVPVGGRKKNTSQPQ